jgi:hypothetical protein
MEYSKFSYKNCPVYRLPRNGWIKIGDMVDGSGRNALCLFGAEETVPDRSISVDLGFQHGNIIGYKLRCTCISFSVFRYFGP